MKHPIVTAALRVANALLFLVLLLMLGELGRAQNPQTALTNPQAIQGINSKWTNGTAPGYYPKCNASSCNTLVLHIGAGTCFDTTMVRHTYAGGTLTMTGSTTNYVFLNQSDCSLAQNTTGYGTTAVPLATVTTSGSAITGLTDDRTMFVTNIVGLVSGSSGGSPFFYYPNNATGTTLHGVARLNGGNVQDVATTDGANTPIAGIVIGGAGTTGVAQVQIAGSAMCDFDGSPTAGDVVTWSSTANHKCHDLASFNPPAFATRYCIGHSEVTSGAGAGTYPVDLGACGAVDNGGGAANGFIPMYSPLGGIAFPSGIEIINTNGGGSIVNTAGQWMLFGNGLTAAWAASGGGNSADLAIHSRGNSTANPGSEFTCDPSGQGYSCNFKGGIAGPIESFGTNSGSLTFHPYNALVHTVTANGNVTLANPDAQTPGQLMIFQLCEDGTGTWTWTFGSHFINPPTPSILANSCSVPHAPTNFMFYAIDSTHLYTVSSF